MLTIIRAPSEEPIARSSPPILGEFPHSQAVKYESNVGFFEPFVQYFNNSITVIYADDFTPMLLLLTGSIKDSRKEQSIYSHTYDIKKRKWSVKRKL